MSNTPGEKWQADEMAKWQLRVLIGYCESGSSIVQQSIQIWILMFVAAMSVFLGFFAAKPEPSSLGGFLITFLFLVGIIAALLLRARDSKKRAKIIQNMFKKLADGKPILLNEFTNALDDIAKVEQRAW